jgi:phosphatidylglycerol---prolipoprotein diacylglyceryl transferase
MEFPVYFSIGTVKIHPHPIFESLAYFVSLRIALHRFRQNPIAQDNRGVVIAGGLLGGILGAKILAIFQHLDMLWSGTATVPMLLIGGKTIVGALLGATFGVEITKKLRKIDTATGDVFAYPLIIGIAIGRIGCFLTGLSDQTYGVPSNLPWAIDFGDHIPRHPTQLYEIFFLFSLLLYLQYRQRKPMQPGDLFRFFMICYLSFRWSIDFIKPDFHPLLGMSAIQIACLLGLVYYRQATQRLFWVAKRL